MNFLKKYKDNFEIEIEKTIKSMGEKTKLRDACEYALKGGKRFRPILTLLISDSIKKYDVTSSAIAVELFHTASLISDDLPCMDDENERRNKPSLHKVFGESISVLASYTFIAKGYEMIVKNKDILRNYISEEESNSICIKAIKEASDIAGILGATNGQFLDLYPPDNSLNTILQIMKQKTANLFSLSFILGWLFGGGDKEKLEYIKEASNHFGMAFQIADDIKDAKEDKKSLNIVHILGKKKSIEMFLFEIDQFSEKLKRLNIFTSYFQKIKDKLIKSI